LHLQPQNDSAIARRWG